MTKEDFRGEWALYPWACKQCGKQFVPRRMNLLRGSPFQTCCDDCQADNLLKMIFGPTEEEE